LKDRDNKRKKLFDGYFNKVTHEDLMDDLEKSGMFKQQNSGIFGESEETRSFTDVNDAIDYLHSDDEIVYKIINNGRLTVNNVPYTKYSLGYGPDGKDSYLTSDVIYNLAKIFTYMLDNNIYEFDYNDFEKER
jgi:hypothetical protein